MGLFSKLKNALTKTAKVFKMHPGDWFREGEILDDDQLERFEARLIQTDMGVVAATQIVDNIRSEHGGRKVDLDEIWQTVRDTLKQLLRGEGDVQFDLNDPLSPIHHAESGTSVILVSGVNGVGKTTSIAKLANFIMKNDKKVVLAAADTFRAAAVEQLAMWSERLGCDIVKKESGADPAAVAYEGCKHGVDTGADYVIVDTAGRLQTQKNLMDELGKIARVTAKVVPDAPHESLLVLDATTGQNGLSQARNFSDAVNSTGIVLSKLDGSAKGGVVVAIRQTMGIPVKYVGVGEQIDDLELFDPDGFVEALFED